MTEELFCDSLTMILTKSSTPFNDSRIAYDFDVDFSFRHQLFEEEPNNINAQSSEIVGSISNCQSPQLNKTSSETLSSSGSK